MKIKKKKYNIGNSTKSAVVYTLATLFSRGLAIITVPIFTRIMTTSQIGTVNLYNSWYSLISAFATLSLTSGGYVVALTEYQDKRDEYQSSVLTLTSVVAIFIAAIFFVAPSFWSQIIGLPVELCILMLLGFLFAPAQDFWLARQRFEYRYKVPAVVIACSAILASAVSVTTVLFLNSVESTFIAEGRLFANYIVLYGVAAVLWIVTMIKGKVLFNKEYWFFSLKLSFPLIGYSVAAQILNVSDRTMISKMVNDSAVGIYSTLYTVSSLSLMIWQAIHASFVPFLFKNIGQEKNDIKKISGWLIILYAFVAIIMTYLAPEIVKILAPEEYYNAIYIMPPIAAGVFLTCFTNIYSDIPVFYKKTKYVMYPAIIAAIMNLVLNYIFIGIFGYMAAAYTTLVSYIVWAILQAVWARKIASEYGIKNGCVYSDRLLILIASITISLCLFGLVLYQNTQMRYLVSSMVVLIGGCFSVYMRKKKIL